MLTEERYQFILKKIEEKRSVTVQEICEELEISESTARRDITALSKLGKLTKVFGGAVALENSYTSHEPTVAQKVNVNREEKQLIARNAAEMIEPEDFVYLDAGTTTGSMLPYIQERNATYVTNAVAHAQFLAKEGFKVLLIGGELKASTEAVVGGQAMTMLSGFYFSKGFFGTNGISRQAGYTTPDANEALVKQTAMKQSKERYVLADVSKFGNISSVAFGAYEDAVILTNAQPPEPFSGDKEIVVVKNREDR